jgi:hypothetical protein
MSKGGTVGHNHLASCQSLFPRCMPNVTDLPARVRVGSPRATNTIQFVVESEIVETKGVLQSIRHGDARRASTDDNCIQPMRVLRHDWEGETGRIWL